MGSYHMYSMFEGTVLTNGAKPSGRLERWCFAALLSLSLLFSAAVLLNAPEMAASHTEPQYGIAMLQIFVALVLAAVFSISRSIRSRPHWFFIPIVLFGAALLYVPVTNMFPCCSGG